MTKWIKLLGLVAVLMIWTALESVAQREVQKVLRSENDLATLEKKVQAVAKKSLPATVALMDENAGSSGTGILVSKDGLILTAAHVVGGSRQMTVILSTGEPVKGRVLGANFSKDIAMVQIEEPPKKGQKKRTWPHVQMGDSDRMSVGDWVVVIGHAEGFNYTRTAPVRFGRLLGHRTGNYILSDCPMVGGDSGGPIFDLDGRVVGINSSIGQELSHNRHAGISGLKKDFAALKSGKQWGSLSEDPRQALPESPALGVGLLRKEIRGGGALILSVSENSPAEKAGFQPRDVIVGISGDAVRNFDELKTVLSTYRPGEEVTVVLRRGREEIRKRLTLAKMGDLFRKKK